MLKSISSELVILVCLLLFFTAGATAQLPEAGDEFAYAERLYRDGYTDLAIEQYKVFLKIYPQEKRVPAALRRIAEGYEALGNYAEARAWFERLQVRYPDSEQAADSGFRIARCFEQEGNIAAAARAYEMYARFVPADVRAPHALLRAAALRQQLGEHHRARTLLYEIIDRYGDARDIVADARLQLLQDFFVTGEVQRAFQAADAFLNDFSDILASARVWLIKAELHRKMGQYRHALTACETVRKKFPTSPESTRAAFLAAELHFAIGETAQTYDVLEKLAAAKNDSIAALALLQKSRYLIETGDYDAAARAFDGSAVADLAPDALLLKARIASALGRHETALQDYTEWLRTVPPAPDSLRAQAWLASAWSALQIGRTETALSMLDSVDANAARPEWRAQALLLRARIAMRAQDDPARAIRLYDDFTRRFSRHPAVDQAQFELARGYQKLQQFPLARVEWDRFLALYPASELYEDAARQRELILKYHLVDLSDLADRLADSVLQAGADDAGSNKARRYMMLRSYEKAIPVLKKLLAVPEQEAEARAEAMMLLGEAYFALGEKNWLIGEPSATTWYDSARVVLRHISSAYAQTRFRKKAVLLSGTIALHERADVQAGFLDSLSIAHASDAAFAGIHVFSLRRAVRTIPADSLQRAVLARRIETLALLDDGRYADQADLLGGRFYLGSGDTLTAVRLLENAAKRMPPTPAAAQAGLLLARTELQQGRVEQAQQRLKKLQKDYFYSPVADSALFLLARAARQIGAYGRAVEYMQKLRSRRSVFFQPGIPRPGSADERFFFAEILARAGKKIPATAEYLAFLRDHRTDRRAPDALLALARLAGDSKAVELARSYYQTLMSEFPQTPQARTAVLAAARLEFRQGQYALARKLALQYYSPQDTSAATAEAMALAIKSGLRLGRIQATENEIKNLRTRFPKRIDLYADIQYELGDAWIRAKNFRKAEKTFKNLRKKTKNKPQAIYAEFGLGKALLIQNKFDDALKLLTRIPSTWPQHPFLREVYLFLADFYQAQRQWDNAISALKKATADTTYDTLYKRSLAKLVDVYDASGIYEYAIATARKYLQMFPYDERAMSFKIRIGRFYRDMRQYDLAVAHYKSLVPFASGEDKAEILYFLAESLMKNERYEQAAAGFLRLKYLNIKTKQNWRTTALYQAGQCFMKMQKYDKARDLFELVIRLEGRASTFGRAAQSLINQIDQLADSRS